MTPILQTLTEKVSAAFEQCGYDGKLGTVTVSDRLDLCQFQCNGAFAGAKLYRKAPKMIADEVAAVLAADEMFAKAETAGAGFLNLTLCDQFLTAFVNSIAADEHNGVPQADVPETIVMDYGGPNVAKPLHIGHLRPAIIGEAMKRIARAAGHKVISDIHMGDWGLPIGLVIAELEVRHPDWACFAPDFPAGGAVPTLDADSLNEIYPFASAKSKEDADFRLRAQAVTAALQDGAPGFTALWKEILRVSVQDMRKNYTRLGVDFDLWYGESDASAFIPRMMNMLKEKKLLRESEGALVVDVAEESDKAPVPPVIVQKSDGADIYATTDLATILQRQEDFSPTRVWYFVDIRQSLHFLQVFRCAKLAGIVPETTELAFNPNGTMNGPDGKPFKTRDGGVLPLSAFFDMVLAEAKARIAQSAHGEDGDKDAAAEKIACAAIKFGDLINHRAKDYIFDMDKFMSSEGKTGAYILYTIARINSVLRKAGGCPAGAEITVVTVAEERALLLTIALGSQAVLGALAEKAPSFICEYAYNLAVAFSKFYHACPIASEADAAVRGSRLALAALTKAALIQYLDMLGIEPVDFM
ncbi:MAG: arginine--tRNA ligase [Oscillospiraceae bacterium]